MMLYVSMFNSYKGFQKIKCFSLNVKIRHKFQIGI